MTLRGALAVVVLLAPAACRRDAAPDAPPPPAPRPAREKSGPLLDQVAAIAVSDAAVWVGTDAGLVRLSPLGASFTLHAGDGQTSLEGVTDVVLGSDGTAWTTHRAPTAEQGEPATSDEHPRRGGVRALGPDGTLRGWGAADGLGQGDVVAIALRGARVSVAAPAGVVEWTPPSDGRGKFIPLLAGESRRVELLDPETGARRVVTEFRPRDERVLALAAEGEALMVGTTHGLFRLDAASVARVAVPCRVAERTPASVLALAAGAGRVVASLGLADGAGGFLPGGVLELWPAGAAHCHAPGIDVPESLTLDVAVEGDTTWLATYEGLVVIRGSDVELVDADRGLPRAPVTAACGDGRGGCWAGTWGGGLLHVQPATQGTTVTRYRFRGTEGPAEVETLVLR